MEWAALSYYIVDRTLKSPVFLQVNTLVSAYGMGCQHTTDHVLPPAALMHTQALH